MDDQALTRRAYVAFMRSGSYAPTPKASGVIEIGGKSYVVLRIDGVLAAVYRVRPDGALKRLRRWPKAIG
jgi:hypothetical protein